LGRSPLADALAALLGIEAHQLHERLITEQPAGQGIDALNPQSRLHTVEQDNPERKECLVPGCDGVRYGHLPSQEALWDSDDTAASARQRQCVKLYSRVNEV